jgi:pyruvate dehydrogenase complex dehydrogenase (E1) component
MVFFACTGMYFCSGHSYRLSNTPQIVFYLCRIMFGCYRSQDAGDQSTFSQCYMHASGTTDPVADTAAGGYNRNSP